MGSKKADEVFSMSLQEFYMLASLRGLEEVYGFVCDMESQSDEDMVKILYGLAKKQILKVENDTFQLEQPYKKMMDYVQYTNIALRIQSADTSIPVCIAYMGEKFLITKVSPVNSSQLLLQWREKSELSQYLKEAGYYENLWEGAFGKESNCVLLELRLIKLPQMQIQKMIAIEKRQEQYRILYSDKDGNAAAEEGLQSADYILDRLISGEE